MKYQFMEQQRRYHRVEKMARVLEVSRSGYYMWLKRQPSRREQEDGRLVDERSVTSRRSLRSSATEARV